MLTEISRIGSQRGAPHVGGAPIGGRYYFGHPVIIFPTFRALTSF